LGHVAQRDWAPIYLQGLLSRSPRKSATALGAEVAPGEEEQLHHFVCSSPWPAAKLQAVLAVKAQQWVGGPESHLIVDDTALVKQGRCSVGVAYQYGGELGKRANCQCLVTLSLAQEEVPVPLALRLYLPGAWCEDQQRRRQCGVPEEIVYRPKWQIALEEIDRLRAAGVTFGDVLADVGYGKNGEFRRGLEQRQLGYAVGLMPNQQVYAAGVTLTAPNPKQRRKHPVPSTASLSAEQSIAALGPGAWQTVSWREGTKGALSGRFAAVRVRVADGLAIARDRHLPGEKEQWLVAEERKNGEWRYSLSTLPETATLLELARQLKGRWSCEPVHEQLKQELGLDHFEGRSWLGLHHHALLAMIAFAFLVWLRLQKKKDCQPWAAALAQPACRQKATDSMAVDPIALSPLSSYSPLPSARMKSKVAK
jgi:SRSO17 transposase